MGAEENTYYDGPVCYVGDGAVALGTNGEPLEAGWHYSIAVEEGPDGEIHTPDRKLHLEDSEDGSQSRYRFATDEDVRSWHDRKHRQFQTFQLEDVEGGERISDPAEVAAIRETLDRMRAGSSGGEEGGEA